MATRIAALSAWSAQRPDGLVIARRPKADAAIQES